MKSLVFKPYTQIWESTFCKSCLLIFLCLLALEEPKWYSRPELSWHSNDLGIASPLYGPPDENQGQLHAQRFMHISLQDVCNFYKNIMIFRSRKKIFKEKAVSWRLSVSKILNEPPLDSEGTVCTSSLNPTLSLLHYLHLSGRQLHSVFHVITGCSSIVFLFIMSAVLSHHTSSCGCFNAACCLLKCILWAVLPISCE